MLYSGSLKVCGVQSAGTNLKLNAGEQVLVEPVSGPLLQATEVLVSSRSKDDKLDTDDFKNFFLRTFDGNVILPGNAVSLSYFGRSCSLRIERICGEDGVTLQRPAPPLGQDPEVEREREVWVSKKHHGHRENDSESDLETARETERKTNRKTD
uniref:Uncharacterized protein n=1 Tax=Knipowitschia caucasica TaxID=637954 RepID=A0AAV2MHQ9_KNICA